jgi:FAD/FMN-containing dehydrogenase
LEPYLDGDGSRDRRKAVKALEKLQGVLEGSVIFANSDGFCDAAEVWQQGLQPPLAVIEVASEADVQLAIPILVEIYIKRGIPFRVRSGGHSYGGFSTVESGIVLSLSGLNNIAFDKSTGVATIGPAVKVQDLLDGILVPDGYGGVVGGCPGVAEGGFVLGK